MALSQDIRDLCVECAPVGSRITCNPPPTDTDEDWLLLVNDIRIFKLIASLQFQRGGSNILNEIDRTPAEERFKAYRHGDLNLIITQSGDFYRRFMAASSVAKRLNPMRKADRVALFQAVLYGNADEFDGPLD